MVQNYDRPATEFGSGFPFVFPLICHIHFHTINIWNFEHAHFYLGEVCTFTPISKACHVWSERSWDLHLTTKMKKYTILEYVSKQSISYHLLTTIDGTRVSNDIDCCGYESSQAQMCTHCRCCSHFAMSVHAESCNHKFDLTSHQWSFS